MKNSILCAVLLAVAGVAYSAEIPGGKEYTNSIGMKFVRIEPGSFMMGLENKALPEGAGVRYFPGHYKEGKLPPAAGWKGHRKGLVGVIYDGDRPMQFVQTSQIDFDWTKEKRREDTWVTCWRGFIKSPITGKVKFEAEYDHGMRLTIDSKVVIDGWTDRQVRSGTIALVKDEMASFVLEYMRKNEPDYLKRVYNHELVISRDELPNWK